MYQSETAPNRVRIDPHNPNWTIPRTYGVWELAQGYTGKKYRIGNYPVRGKELENEFNAATLIALYTERDSAVQHAAQLNAN